MRYLPILILFMGFGLRLVLHDFHGLEGDDGVSLALSRYDLNTLIPGLMALQLDVHPPLHYVALKGWTAIAGDSLFSLRLMNALLDVLTGALVMALAGRSVGIVRCAPTTAGMLWALAPLLIFTGYLIRMYTLLTLFITAGAVCVVSAPGRRAAWWYVGATVFTLAAMYTHIIGIVVLGAFASVIVVNGLLRRVNVRNTLAGMGGMVVAGLLYLPFAIPVWDVYRSGRQLGAEYNPGNFASPLEVPGAILNTLLTHRLLNSAVPGFVVLIVFGAGSVFVVRRYGTRTLPLLLLVWISIVAASGLAVVAGLYKPRYLAAFAPMLLALLAGMVWLIPGRVLRGAALFGLVILSGWGILIDLDHAIRDDWVAATAFVSAHEQPGDTVIVIPDWGQEAFRFHYRGAAPVTGVFPTVSPEVDLDAIMESLVEGYDRAWLVRYQPEVSDPANRADGWFRARAVTMTEVFPAGMQVKLYDFSPELAALPASARPIDARFGDAVALRGGQLPVSSGRARDTRLHPPSTWVQVILYWEILRPGANVVPRVRLTDAYGQVYGGALERDNDLLHRLPVTAWESGTLYRMAYDLNLNPETPPGVYNIEVTVLDSDEPLPATGADAGELWVIAGQFSVE